MTETITSPCIRPDMDEATYHRDPVEWGSLSASSAKDLLPPSCPARFQHKRTHPAATDSMERGTVIHGLVLGSGPEIVVVQRTAKDGTTSDADDYKTVSAQDHRDEIRADGKIPMLRVAYDKAVAAARAVREHSTARVLLERDGQAELSMFWQHQPTGVWRRGRIDWLTGRFLTDLKTTPDANPAAFGKSVANYAYHQQMAGYVEGAQTLDLVGDDVACMFVLVEPEPPFLVSVGQLDPDDLALGAALNRQACEVYARCSATDDWPAYGDDVALISTPGWYRRQLEGLTS